MYKRQQPESKTVTGIEAVTLSTCPVAATPDTFTVTFTEESPESLNAIELKGDVEKLIYYSVTSTISKLSDGHLILKGSVCF